MALDESDIKIKRRNHAAKLGLFWFSFGAVAFSWVWSEFTKTTFYSCLPWGAGWGFLIGLFVAYDVLRGNHDNEIFAD